MPLKITLTILFCVFFIVSCKKNNPSPSKSTPEISGFNIGDKYVGDATFLIPQVASNSQGTFTYSSSDTSVASIKGDSIQIHGVGTVTITAMQTETASFAVGLVTTSFKVLPSVYITGWASGPSGDQPLFWRNGVATNLSGLGTTNSIFIHGNDVYIGGSVQYNGDGYGGYWKNGVPHPIQKDGIVEGIAVLGNDVYAVGYQINYQTYISTATLWKNDVAIPLTNPLACCGVVSSSAAWAIAIHNNSVYISGTSANPNNYGTATIWKEDGSAVAFTKPSMTTGTDTVSTGWGITFQGNDMYISGSVGTAFGNDYLGYWKNGTFFANPSPSPPYPNNTSIVVKGSDVYTAGIHAENGVLSAAYWKNGAETILASNATATGMAFSGNDMYVVGTTLLPNSLTSQPSPVYWINGTLVKLPAPVPDNTMATSIFVRNQ